MSTTTASRRIYNAVQKDAATFLETVEESFDPQRHTSLPFDESPADPPGSLRLRLVYLEDDPDRVTPQLRDVEAAFSGSGELVLSTPVHTIIPWQDW